MRAESVWLAGTAVEALERGTRAAMQRARAVVRRLNQPLAGVKAAARSGLDPAELGASFGAARATGGA